jgi:hypothetical protein
MNSVTVYFNTVSMRCILIQVAYGMMDLCVVRIYATVLHIVTVIECFY